MIYAGVVLGKNLENVVPIFHHVVAPPKALKAKLQNAPVIAHGHNERGSMRRYIHNDAVSYTTNDHADEGYEVEVVDAKDYDELKAKYNEMSRLFKQVTRRL